MTPSPIDLDVVARRLRMLRDAIDELRSMGGVDRERYVGEPIIRAAVERFLQVIVDLAIDVNAHVVAVRLGRVPTTGRESFVLMAEAGVLDAELAERLAPAASMRNILVHRYTDIDPTIIVDAIPRVIEEFAEYVKVVSTYLLAQ